MRNVEDTLLRWQDWDVPWSAAPRLERKLAGGSTNQSYLLHADERLWVLRLNAQNAFHLGIDRQRESVIIERAAAAGIAPAIVYCSIEHGVLITEFINGQHWPADALDDPGHRSRLLELVRTVHALEVDTVPIDYYAHAERYWAALIAAHVDIPPAVHRKRDQVLQQLEANSIGRESAHLCHHDLNPSNIIDRDGRLYLIDWEYAAHGSRAFDYAAIASEWKVPLAYFQEYAGIDLRDLDVAANLYRYICCLWLLLSGKNGLS